MIKLDDLELTPEQQAKIQERADAQFTNQKKIHDTNLNKANSRVAELEESLKSFTEKEHDGKLEKLLKDSNFKAESIELLKKSSKLKPGFTDEEAQAEIAEISKNYAWLMDNKLPGNGIDPAAFKGTQKTETPNNKAVDAFLGIKTTEE